MIIGKVKTFSLAEVIEMAYSEGYNEAQREYARKDYVGLGKEAAERLKAKRSQLAKQLAAERNAVRKTQEANLRMAKSSTLTKEEAEALVKQAKANTKSKYESLLKKADKTSDGLRKEEILEDLVKSGKMNDIANDIARKDMIAKGIRVGVPVALAGTSYGVGKYQERKRKKKQEAEA